MSISHDLRESPNLALDTCRFQRMHHVPKNLKFNEPNDIKAYEKETAADLSSVGKIWTGCPSLMQEVYAQCRLHI